MDESTHTVEMLVGQFDNRMAFIEQNLTEIRGQLAQLRREIRQEIAQVPMPQDDISAISAKTRAEFRRWRRLTVGTLILLYGILLPFYMWIWAGIFGLR